MFPKSSHGRSRRRSDDVIKEEICEILEEAPNVNCSHIDVSVKNGVVTLRGAARQFIEKQQVEDLVEYVPGVNEVQSKLKVQRTKHKNRLGLVSRHPNNH